MSKSYHAKRIARKREGPPPLGQGSGPSVDDGPGASVHSCARPPRPVPSHRIPRTLMALGATGLPREGAEKGRDAAGILGVPETPFPTMSAPGARGGGAGPRRRRAPQEGGPEAPRKSAESAYVLESCTRRCARRQGQRPTILPGRGRPHLPLGQGSGPPVNDGPGASVHSCARPPRPVPSHRIPSAMTITSGFQKDNLNISFR